MASLFPDLPDNVGWECLLRVELNSHHNLRCISKSWNAVLKNPTYYEERKKRKISEQRICLMDEIHNNDNIHNRVVIYDLEKNTCKSILPTPNQIDGSFHCHFVKQKLVLISDFETQSTRNRVWLYDFVHLKWREGAEMPRLVTGFASAVDEKGGQIYVGGGYEDALLLIDAPWLPSASVYNVEEDKWEDLPQISTFIEPYISDLFKGVFVDGKFYMMRDLDRFDVFDTHTRSWVVVEDGLNMLLDPFSSGHFVSAIGHIYFLTDDELIEYDFNNDKVKIVGTMPAGDYKQHIYSAIEVNNKIFVSRSPTKVGVSGLYILTLPSEKGGTFELLEIQMPSEVQGRVTYAATLDL